MEAVMDRRLVSSQEHEIETLARKHGTTVEKVREIIRRTGARSRKEIDQAVESHFRHRPKTEHAR
jgi:hypothetical protein